MARSSIEVILLENLRNLGKLGDKVKVKAGFGRNYLIPQGKAEAATPENIVRFEERRAELEKQAQAQLAAAQARAAGLAEQTVTLAANAGDEGKLFGSIGTRDIAKAISDALDVQVEKSEVRLPQGTIRQVGQYTIAIQLHNDVAVDITLSVVPE